MSVPTAIDLFAAVHESGYGTKRTFRKVGHLVAIGGKADIVRNRIVIYEYTP
jgi:hypothetical protein